MGLNPEIMYDALIRKDSSYEGLFYAAIRTTGIFCRPTCTARKPKPENVEYFTTAREAMMNGYRPCRLCHPLESPGNIPSYIQNLISKIEEDPLVKISDSDLVNMNIEPNRVRRWFKSRHGITFQGYQRMMRINTAWQQLSAGSRVTDAAFDNGYDSLSGFSDAFKYLVGESPSRAGQAKVINMHRFSTPLGPMIACAVEEGICLVEFTDRRMLESELKDLKVRLGANILYGYNKHFAALEKQMREYFEGTRKSFNLPLLTPGSQFQNLVWEHLLKIPYGETRTYKGMALALENKNAVRAVARANGMNRIAIIIPCHRVIGEDGSMTGYSGGISRKRWLIDFEMGNL
ncbi:MAG TPA: methylated-DNA--[protein]-cysteine S-methyltransferase [Cyclobacteriaceae bacterium]|nr:methylated-DNA--[protein]-cysteine S-methyltransferase [Cyclobacteriaceae bacterium]